MNSIDRALRNLSQVEGRVNSEIIKDLIDDHAPQRKRMIALYERYKGTEAGVPVLTRIFEDATKINNQLANDFFGEIIDTKVGYFAGKPVSYSLDKNAYTTGETLNETAYGRDQQVISDFNLRSMIEDLDAETAKVAATCGLAARLLYIDKDGLERVMLVDPWECIWVYDRSINEPQFALRYYTVQIQISGEWVNRKRVEWYDQTSVTYYIEQDGDYVPDNTEPKNPQRHMFTEVPLIAFENNAERLADGEKAFTLIDGYDNALSDVNSELEQFRLAYMAFYGVEPDAETLAKAMKTGAFGLPDTDAKIEFITKDLNDTIIENHLNRLENNILRFAKSVNFTDEAFGGNLSGVAMKFKVFGLESKCITAERKFTSSLMRQYRILCTAWKKKGIAIDYLNIIYQFKRNFPLNLLDEAQTSVALKGQVSEQTRLGLLSFVDDTQYELDLMAKDNEGAVNLDDIEEDDDEDTQ